MMSLFQKMKPMEYLESTVAAFSLISNNEKSAQQGADFDFDLDFSEALTLLEPAHNYELRKLRIPSDKHDNPGEVVAICTNCFCAMRKLKPPANWVWLNTNDDNESNKPVYAVRVECGCPVHISGDSSDDEKEESEAAQLDIPLPPLPPSVLIAFIYNKLSSVSDDSDEAKRDEYKTKALRYCPCFSPASDNKEDEEFLCSGLRKKAQTEERVNDEEWRRWVELVFESLDLELNLGEPARKRTRVEES
ncbi:hypothetical protein ScalyP_jg1065 [Parmales sp. scaly parma]|nr:hypothetical protein ScalyP_jg1065 [Parmales sp. scaly parma]